MILCSTFFFLRVFGYFWVIYKLLISHVKDFKICIVHILEITLLHDFVFKIFSFLFSPIPFFAVYLFLVKVLYIPSKKIQILRPIDLLL